ncbi:MAG: BlaI/MecI/CopY family transcriptional regulator [Planctomycetaceae bacterium]
MSGKPQVAISDAEREVLNILWDAGQLQVKDVLARLVETGQQWTRSTVVTLLHRLEAKGYIGSDKSGYAFIYRSLVSREEVIHERVKELAGKLSNGQAVPLMLAFAERHTFTPDELARLQKMVDDLKQRSRKN